MASESESRLVSAGFLLPEGEGQDEGSGWILIPSPWPFPWGRGDGIGGSVAIGERRVSSP